MGSVVPCSPWRSRGGTDNLCPMLANGGTTRNNSVLAVVAVVLGLAGLLVMPLIATPVMILTGILWRGGPRWARLTLIATALLFAAYFLIGLPVHSSSS